MHRHKTHTKYHQYLTVSEQINIGLGHKSYGTHKTWVKRSVCILSGLPTIYKLNLTGLRLLKNSTNKIIKVIVISSLIITISSLMGNTRTNNDRMSITIIICASSNYYN